MMKSIVSLFIIASIAFTNATASFARNTPNDAGDSIKAKPTHVVYGRDGLPRRRVGGGSR